MTGRFIFFIEHDRELIDNTSNGFLSAITMEQIKVVQVGKFKELLTYLARHLVHVKVTRRKR